MAEKEAPPAEVQLQLVDYAACLCYLAAVTVLGLRSSAGRARSSEEFLLAGRSIVAVGETVI